MPIYKFSLCLFTLLFLSGCPFDDTSRTITQEEVTPPVTDPNNPDTEKPPVTDPDPDIEKPPVTDPDIEKPPVTDPDIETPPPPPPPPPTPIFKHTGLYFDDNNNALALAYGSPEKPQISLFRDHSNFLHYGDLIENKSTPNTYDSSSASISTGNGGGLNDSFQIETEPTKADFNLSHTLALLSGVNQSSFSLDYFKVQNSFPLSQFEGSHVSSVNADWVIKIEGSKLTLSTGTSNCVVTGSVEANEFFYTITDASATGCANSDYNGTYQGQLLAYDVVNNPAQGKVQTLAVSFQNDTNKIWSSVEIKTPPAEPAFIYSGLFYSSTTNFFVVSYGSQTIPKAAMFRFDSAFLQLDKIVEIVGDTKRYSVEDATISSANAGGLPESFAVESNDIALNFMPYPDRMLFEQSSDSGGSSSSLARIKSILPANALAGTYVSASNSKWSINIDNNEFVLKTESCVISGSLQIGTAFYFISEAKAASCANELNNGSYEGQLFGYYIDHDKDPATPLKKIIAINLVKGDDSIWSFILTN